MSIKSQFSIKDLENLSGVKAHTIRIWEKRYNLLQPERTDTNIRRYSTKNLKKLLDVTYLYNEGYKISKIATLEDTVLKEMITTSITAESAGNIAIKDLKKVMLSFDSEKFATIYDDLRKQFSFHQIFTKIFVPLLQQIGTLWHSDAINVIHERFISELIKQKTIFYIEKQNLKNTFSMSEYQFCLFLPQDELHEIGLLYANFLLKKHHFNTIYLGRDIPLNDLLNLPNCENFIFVAYTTVAPDLIDTSAYFTHFNSTFASKSLPKLWLLGSQAMDIDKSLVPANITQIDTIDLFVQILENLKKS